MKFTTATIGRIQGSIIDADKDIVISTIQSISKAGKYPEDIFEQFGTIIFDEGHHIVSKMFSQAPLML